MLTNILVRDNSMDLLFVDYAWSNDRRNTLIQNRNFEGIKDGDSCDL